MNTALLILTLLSAEESAPASPDESAAPPAEVVAEVEAPAAEVVVAPVSDLGDDEWPGEGVRRVRFGVGARVNTGFVYPSDFGYPVPELQSEFAFFIAIRVFGHHEWRVGLGLTAGLPDLFGGVTNTSFRFHLNPRFSVGVGVITYLSLWSVRAGLEVPFAVRLGANRRYEVSLTLRATTGGYNASTFRWYDFDHQQFAVAANAVLGFSAFF